MPLTLLLTGENDVEFSCENTSADDQDVDRGSHSEEAISQLSMWRAESYDDVSTVCTYIGATCCLCMCVMDSGVQDM